MDPIPAQPLQHEKVAVANTLIRNEGSFAETWRQVSMGWRENIPVEEVIPSRVEDPKGELAVEKARPRQAAEIASLINHLSKGKRNLTSDDVLASFGEKAFIMLRQDDRTVGLAGWQDENLVARTGDVYLEPELALPNAMRALLEEIERASRDLQCEVSLLFLPPRLSQQDTVWHNLAYEQRSIPSLGVKAWQEAAQETMSGDEVMFFKLLRRDRVLRPV